MNLSEGERPTISFPPRPLTQFSGLGDSNVRYLAQELVGWSIPCYFDHRDFCNAMRPDGEIYGTAGMYVSKWS
jgi:hypothetical protein